ncbi:RNA ligase [Candidatus Micrarchaeota archaeon]|nr:RNA ligase [Candidatus Micrarchaeota archaeon]
MTIQPESLVPDIARDLDVSAALLRMHLLSKSLYAVESSGFSFLRFRQPCGKVEEGTVVFETPTGGVEYMRGFPKIRRVYDIGAGLRKHFPTPFYVEEKMDGYNVRCALVGGRFAAVTKGGLVCPYTTENLRHVVESGFFHDHPSLMLCGEVVGLANPYQTKSYPRARDFGFFVFDARDRVSGKPLPPEKRYRIVKEYGLKGVRVLGKSKSSDSRKLLSLVRKIGEDEREGIVIKSLDGCMQAKYTSNQSTNSDLRYAFRFPFDYAQAFFFRRLVREAFQAHELGLKGAALKREAARLGESLLIPLVQTIRDVSEGREVVEEFELLVPSREFAANFVEHLRHLGVKASMRSVKREGRRFRAKVARHYQSTNDKTRSYLEGEFGGE